MQPVGYFRRKWGVTGAFNPPDIAGLIGWWATDGTLWQDSVATVPVGGDTQPVGRWDDASGGGRHLLQATGGFRPAFYTNIQNGRAVVRFDGSDDFLRAVYTQAQPVTIFMVAKATGVSARYSFDGGGGSPGTAGSLYWAAANQLRIHAGTAQLATAGTSALNTWYVWSAIFNGASSGLWQNGVSLIAANAGANTTGGFTLGATTGGSVPEAQDVGEVLIYNSALSSTDRSTVETYLNGRWAVY